jgi:hypothetical protein
VQLVELESAVVDEGGPDWGLAGVCRTQLSGTVMSIVGKGEHGWDRLGAVYASDVCQFRGI